MPDTAPASAVFNRDLPAGPRLDRAVAAYGRILEADAEDSMVTDELARIPASRTGAGASSSSPP
ncbi:hypothetical protein OG982_30055 [Streptomyces sp. NBC_01551]|uniref:hypothetical protein n=1 Tax=Streptomyces sp. NBC_01551 TaxID=2975876 RepID=UPI002253F808|nr:hypothetical protein [Streptomyces sp. NBC_01551]MCX4529888.1 hypothetical protein [Streptomyces sp. NBC_01551]